jgi:hypothetical protein
MLEELGGISEEMVMLSGRIHQKRHVANGKRIADINPANGTVFHVAKTSLKMQEVVVCSLIPDGRPIRTELWSRHSGIGGRTSASYIRCTTILL